MSRPSPATAGRCPRLLLHLIEETARHAGNADILRESLDGRTAFGLVDEERAAREG
jgi:hypothetical protein